LRNVRQINRPRGDEDLHVCYFDVEIVVSNVEPIRHGSSGDITEGKLASWKDRGIRGESLLAVNGFGEVGLVDGF
jgi:hypothetical protein